MRIEGAGHCERRWWRVERCCAPVLPCYETYAEYLRATNCCVLPVRADVYESGTGPIPYATFLKNVNEQDRLAASSAAINAMAMPNRALPAGMQTQPPARVMDAPRLSEVSPVAKTEQIVRIEVAYQVRQTLSRGAMLDLVG